MRGTTVTAKTPGRILCARSLSERPGRKAKKAATPISTTGMTSRRPRPGSDAPPSPPRHPPAPTRAPCPADRPAARARPAHRSAPRSPTRRFPAVVRRQRLDRACPGKEEGGHGDQPAPARDGIDEARDEGRKDKEKGKVKGDLEHARLLVPAGAPGKGVPPRGASSPRSAALPRTGQDRPRRRAKPDDETKGLRRKPLRSESAGQAGAKSSRV